MANNSKGSIKRKTTNMKWFNNVAKSLGYTSTELITQMAPGISEFTSSNTEYARELSSNLREMKSGRQRVSSVFKANDQMVIAGTALKNALSDIKSGKIYNKERVEAQYEDDFSMEDFSFDDGDSDGGSSFSFDDEPDLPKSTRQPVVNVKTVVPAMSANNPMVKAMEKHSELTVRAAEATVTSQTEIAVNQMMMNQKIGGGTLRGLESINDNLASLVSFQGETMSKYVGASLKYYEESIGTLKDTLEELKNSTRPADNKSQGYGNMKESDYEKSFLFGGGLDAKGYMSVVKKNLSDQFSSNIFLQPIKAMFEDKDTLKLLAASPLSFIATKITTTLLPQFLQSSIQNLDKSFSNFFPSIAMKLNSMSGSENPFLRTIGEIFGIKSNMKATVDLSKYERGQIPFDGETKKSITEVIPGYLRKILASLDGKEEVAFDMDTGKWSSVKEMSEKFDNDRKSRVTNVYMETINDLKRRSESFEMRTQKDREDFNNGIETFFDKLSQQSELINPNLRRSKDGDTIDDLSKVHDFKDPNMLRLFRQLILTMPKNEQLKMFGKDLYQARQNVNEMMTNAENNPTKNNANTIFNGMGYDDHLKKGTAEVKKGYGLFNPIDKFGHSSLDYIRDIKSILLSGIRVFTSTGNGNMGSAGDASGILNSHATSLTNMNSEKTRYINQENAKKATNYRQNNYSPEQMQKMHADGKVLLDDSYSLDSFTDKDISNHIYGYDAKQKENVTRNQKGGLGQWFGKFIKGNKQDKYNLMREKINTLIEKPAQMLENVFAKIDNTMYNMVFGNPDGKEGGRVSFFERTFASLRDTFDRLGDFVKSKVFDPIKEAFVGENGIITKFKESDSYSKLKKYGSKVNDTLFGEMGEDGKRAKGIFGKSGNAMLDTWDGFRYYFTGKEYTNRAGIKFAGNEKESVFGEVKGMMKNFSSDMKSYFVGDKDAQDPDNQKGVLTTALDGIKSGFHNWTGALFGPKGMTKGNSEQTFKEMMKTMKDRAPKSLAWGAIGGGVGTGIAMTGGMGLLGSLLLPGGPLGAAVLGTSLGFLTQSDKFNDWAFGDKNAHGDRIGGIIGKSTQDFFKKNRVAMLGGATIGALKPILGMGILPSMLLPGGPIAGAALGVAGSMLIRSETFQKTMFGEKDEDGKRMGGIIQKTFGAFKTKNENFKGLGGNTLVGAIGGAGLAATIGKIGFMGAMLTPLGPIGGAVAGAAAGIALSSEKWKKALFGDWDEESGLRKGGLIGKFGNWFKLEVQHPLKHQLQNMNLNLQEWFTKKISNPFTDAIAPMKQAFRNMTDNVSEFFKKGWDGFKEKIGTVFEDHVGKPFGQFMSENVMKPLRGFMMKIISGVGKIFAPIAEAPMKVLSSIGDSLRNSQEKKGLKRHVDDGWDDMADYRGRRDRGERMGFRNTKDEDGNVVGKGVFGRIKEMYFDKNARENAKYGEHGASYAKKEDEAIAKRNKEQDEKFAKQRAELEEKERKLNIRRKTGAALDYENFDTQGNNVSRVYNVTKSNKGFKHFINKDGETDKYKKTIKDHFGFNLHELLQVDEGSLDVANMSRGQRKIVSKAIKSGLKGDALKKRFNINPLETVAEGGEVSTGGSDTTVVKSSIETMTEKLSSVIKDVSPQEQIEKLIAPKMQESKNVLVEIASKIGEALGSTTRSFKAKKTRGSTSQVSSFNDEAVGDTDSVVDIDEYKKSKKTKSKEKDSLLYRIMTYTRITAMEVKGQLDGLGGNVYKIRKLLQMAQGVSDEDISGKGNKDRIGFWGRLRRSFFRPLDTIKEKFTVAIGMVTEKVAAFGKGVFNVTKAIVMAPINIMKSIGKSIAKITQGIGKALQSAFTELIKLPGKLIGVVGSAVDAVGQVIRAFGPAASKIVEGAAGLVSGAAKGLGKALEGIGKGVGSFVYNLGKSLGEVVGVIGKTTVKLLGSVGNFFVKTTQTLVGLGSSLLSTTGKLLGDTTKLIVDFSLKTVAGIADVVKNVSKTLMDIVTAPMKFVSKALGKLLGVGKQEVFVTGGTLDLVREVGKTKSSDSDKDDTGKEVSKTKRFAKILFNEFKNLYPIPVIMQGGGGGGIGPSGGPSGGGGGGGGFNFNGGPDSPGRGKGSGILGSLLGSGLLGVGANMLGSRIGGIGRGVGRGIMGGIRGARSGGLKGALGGIGAALGFGAASSAASNNKKSLKNTSKRNSMSSMLNGAKSFRLIRTAHTMGSGSEFLNSVPGFNNIKSTGSPLEDKLNHMKSFVGRRNMSNEVSAKMEQEEMGARSGHRVANIGLLSMIEHNTRRLADGFNNTFGPRGLLSSLLGEFIGWLMNWLRKFRFRLPNLFKQQPPVSVSCGGCGNGTNGAPGQPGMPGTGAGTGENAGSKPNAKPGTKGKDGSKGKDAGKTQTGPVIKPIPAIPGPKEKEKPSEKDKKQNPAREMRPGRVYPYIPRETPKESPADKPKEVPYDKPKVVPDKKPKEVPAEPYRRPYREYPPNVVPFEPKTNPKPVPQEVPMDLPNVAGGDNSRPKEVPAGMDYNPRMGPNSSGGSTTGHGSSNVGPSSSGRGSNGNYPPNVVPFESRTKETPATEKDKNRNMKQTRKERRQSNKGGRGGGIGGTIRNLLSDEAGFISLPGSKGKPKGRRATARAERNANKPKKSFKSYLPWDNSNKTPKAPTTGNVANKQIKPSFGKRLWAGTKGTVTGKNKVGKALVKPAQIGGKVLQSAGRISTGLTSMGASTLAWGAYDAAQGVANADRILGKDKADLTSSDKTAAAIGSVTTGFIPGAIVIDGLMGGKMTSGIAKGTKGVLDAGKAVGGGIKKGYNNTMAAIGNGAKKGVEKWKEGSYKLWDGLLGGNKKDKEGKPLQSSMFGLPTKEGIKDSAAGKLFGKAFGTKDDKGGLAGDLWSGIENSFKNRVEKIKQNTSKVWDGISTAASSAWDGTQKVVSSVGGKIGTAASKTWDIISTTAGTAWDGAKTAVSNVGGKIGTAASTAWDTISTSASQAWEGAKSTVSSVGSKISTAASSAWDSISSKAGSAWDSTKSAVSKSADSVKSASSKVWSSISTTVSEKWTSAKGHVSEKAAAIASDTKAKWESAKTQASSKLKDLASNTGKKAGEIASDSKAKWDSAKSQASSKLKDLASTAGKKAGEIKSAVTESLSGVGSSIKSALSGLKKKALDLVSFGGGYGAGNITIKAKPAYNYGMGGNEEPELDKIMLKTASSRSHDEKVALMKAEQAEQNEDSKYGAGNKAQKKNGMVYYSQGDSRWANKSLTKKHTKSGLNVKKGGCGPTSAAMVLSAVTGTSITPSDTLKYAQEGGYVDSERGTRSDFFTGVGREYGVNILPNTKDEKTIKSQLSYNNPVILRGQGGKAFTNGGHYVVATGVSSNGKIMVNDPISRERSREYSASSLLGNTTDAFVALNTPNKYAMGPGSKSNNLNYGAGITASDKTVFKGFIITSGYGWRTLGGKREFHTGIDLVKSHGAPLKSFSNGTVIYSGMGVSGSGYGGFGNVVAIKDEKGYTHLYAHLKSVEKGITVGQKVKIDSVIGYQGNTGKVYGSGPNPGSHLHYEVRQKGFGSHVNPGDYLKSYKADKDFKADPNQGDTGQNGIVGDPNSSGITVKIPGPAITPGLKAAVSAVTGINVDNSYSTKINEFFSSYLQGALYGKPAKEETEPTIEYSDGDGGVLNDTPIAGPGASINAPKDLKDAIVKKTIERIHIGESGGNENAYFLGKNGIDANRNRISPDVGFFQWRGGNAKQLMNMMYNQMPNDYDAKYFAQSVDWNSKTPWSRDRELRLQTFLKRNPTVTKQTQLKFAESFVQDKNLTPVYKYGVNQNKLTDPGAIAMLGDFANTGPAHIQKFFNKYTKAPKGSNEFNHFVSQFKSKSYWGPKSLYRNRMNGDISALQNWKPTFGTGPSYAMGGGDLSAYNKIGDGSVALLPKTGEISPKFTKPRFTIKLPTIARSSAPLGMGTGIVKPHITQKDSYTINTSSLDSRSLNDVITILTEIAGNTHATSKGLDNIGQGGVTINSAGQAPNVVVAPSSGGNAGQGGSSDKQKNDYMTAKRIAGSVGRI